MRTKLFVACSCVLGSLMACGGDDDDKVVTSCEQVTCSGHGTCAMVAGVPTCNCENDYHPVGAACLPGEAATDTCSGVTCSGHGTCELAQGSPVCDCDNNFHAVGLTCVADDDQNGNTFAGSCSVSSFYFCIDFTGSMYTAQAAQAACSIGSYSASNCSESNLIGKCTTNAGAPQEAVTYYYTGAGDAGTLSDACTSDGGSWN